MNLQKRRKNLLQKAKNPKNNNRAHPFGWALICLSDPQLSSPHSLIAKRFSLWYSMLAYAPVTELADVRDLGSRVSAWGFESLQAHQKSVILRNDRLFH